MEGISCCGNVLRVRSYFFPDGKTERESGQHLVPSTCLWLVRVRSFHLLFN